MISTRVPLDTSDTVSLIVALLMRYPELASVRSHPTDGTLRVSFVVGASLDKKSVRATRASLIEHIETFLGMDDVTAATLDVECEVAQHLARGQLDHAARRSSTRAASATASATVTSTTASAAARSRSPRSRPR